MKFLPHSVHLPPAHAGTCDRSVILSQCDQQQLLRKPFQCCKTAADTFQCCVRYISDPADVRSMCEGMLYRGIRIETRVIDDVERTRLICNPAFIIIWMHQDAKGLHVFRSHFNYIGCKIGQTFRKQARKVGDLEIDPVFGFLPLTNNNCPIETTKPVFVLSHIFLSNFCLCPTFGVPAGHGPFGEDGANKLC